MLFHGQPLDLVSSNPFEGFLDYQMGAPFKALYEGTLLTSLWSIGYFSHAQFPKSTGHSHELWWLNMSLVTCD